MRRQSAPLLLLAAALFLLTGCPQYGYKYDDGRFPSTPVNFSEVNSVYDDYNSTAPFIESNRYLYFSSNRTSLGGQFDIVGEHMQIFWDKDNGKLSVDDTPHPWHDYNYTGSLFNAINTENNEYGPYALPWLTYSNDSYHFTELLVYANDSAGKFDLRMAWFEGPGENPTAAEGQVYGPHDISFLNTGSNDAYLAFYGPGFINYDYYARDISMITELVFCSDRNGDFDIFLAQVPSGSDILDFLSGDDGTPVESADLLNSSADDKCPYVDGNLLVFASDRPGGYGGFDLYYCKRDVDHWSEPINFGDRINTEYNEYRPIVLYEYEFINDLMIFSSDRPGGQGGYDLYYVGIPRMIQ